MFCTWHLRRFLLRLACGTALSTQNHKCVNPRSKGALIYFTLLYFAEFPPCTAAGGTGGADETGANKDAHQSPVIQLETSNCVPADFTHASLVKQYFPTDSAISFRQALQCSNTKVLISMHCSIILFDRPSNSF